LYFGRFSLDLGSVLDGTGLAQGIVILSLRLGECDTSSTRQLQGGLIHR
jgi:hypothetical protein